MQFNFARLLKTLRPTNCPHIKRPGQNKKLLQFQHIVKNIEPLQIYLRIAPAHFYFKIAKTNADLFFSPAIGGRERSASSPRQGRKILDKCPQRT